MKILMIDIETSPAVTYVWDIFKPVIGVEQIITPTSLLCFSYAWFENGKMGKVQFVDAGGKLEGQAFVSMVRKAHELLSEADAVCHFNGESFDVPRLNAEFLRLRLPPPPPAHQIDLKKTWFKKFATVSSRLAFIGPYLKIGEKVKHEGWPLWIGCLSGDAACWRKMREYNIEDTVLLGKLYETLLAWIDNHPNMNLYDTGAQADDGKPCCTNCASTKLKSNGFRRAQTYTYRRIQCLTCGHWMRERLSTKLAGPVSKVRSL